MKKFIRIFLLAVSVLVLVFVVYMAYGIYSLRDIGISHVEDNVPNEENFDIFLERDLNKYFSKKSEKEVSVKYELFRNNPSQSGLAYPKYYIWVNIYEGVNLIGQGAVRVAAMEKEYFRVTDYLSKNEIELTPNMVYDIFPADVSDKIKAK